MVKSIEDAVSLVAALVARQTTDTEAEPADEEFSDIAVAIASRDTPALFRILMDGFAYQGITDAAARGFIELYGNAGWHDIERALSANQQPCPKLENCNSFVGCGYRKVLRTCANPKGLHSCPVPALPLRKGILNEQGFSLYLLLRDRCGSDLVGFIDQTLLIAAEQPDSITIGREALLSAFTGITGVSRKLGSMMLAMLLMAPGQARPAWLAVGKSMVAIDSLVHNFLHRTGILRVYGAEHLYGQRCFGSYGCEWVINDLSDRLQESSARNFDHDASPRELERSIWRFCAADELSICNGNNIRDTAACELAYCPLWLSCARVPLRSLPAPEAI